MDNVAASTYPRSGPRHSANWPVMPVPVSPVRLETHLANPILPFDYRWMPGEVVWPCLNCVSWHVEVLLDRHAGSVLLREWHAAGCSVWDLDGDTSEQDQA